jgi:hypothetical protein
MHKDKVPWNDWKQTLVNAERYITEELKNENQNTRCRKSKIHKIEVIRATSQLIANLYQASSNEC